MHNNNFWSLLGTKEEEHERLWELYHQNSKITKFDKLISNEDLHRTTADLIIANDYKEYPKTKLSEKLPLFNCSLSEAMQHRTTARSLETVEISFQALSSLLFYGYGITRTNEHNNFPHPFRTVPSAGGLYPLEIYFHHNYIKDLEPGLYHYNPINYEISHLMRGDQTRKMQDLLVQPEISTRSSILIFITAMFERNSFKYGERGYRFAHIEAGHVAQNISLAAMGLDLGTINIGGFLDRKVDAFLKLDGVTCSTLYMMAIGKEASV